MNSLTNSFIKKDIESISETKIDEDTLNHHSSDLWEFNKPKCKEFLCDGAFLDL